MTDQLLDYLRTWCRQPFDWQHHNCGHFAARWVERCTGQAVAYDLLGHFTSAQGLQRLLLRLGHLDLVGLADARLANLAQRRAIAQRGDIVVAQVSGQQAFGLALGDGLAVVPAPRGIITGRLQILAAWGL